MATGSTAAQEASPGGGGLSTGASVAIVSAVAVVCVLAAAAIVRALMKSKRQQTVTLKLGAPKPVEQVNGGTDKAGTVEMQEAGKV